MNNWFANTLVHHPFIVLTAVAVLSGVCLIIPFALQDRPNFSDPQMGFETRGTLLANRKIAWKNLEESTGPSGQFAANPKEFLYSKTKSYYNHNKLKRHNRRNKKPIYIGKPTMYAPEPKINESTVNKWVSLKRLLKGDFQRPTSKSVIGDGYFCGLPDNSYAQIVFESTRDSDLFTLESLLTLCRIEHKLLQIRSYKESCDQTFWEPKRCCRPWSLANYIAHLHERPSCLALLDEDVQATKELLRKCSRYYYNLKLAPDCSETGDCKVPVECTKHDAVFSIMNYLITYDYLPANNSDDTSSTLTMYGLKQSMIFLPIATSAKSLSVYHQLEEEIVLEHNSIAIVAMNFGAKEALFEELLLNDTWLMAIAVIFLLLCIWVYTQSLFLTFMSVIAIGFSLGISYFMYTLVYELKFFPFMNLLAIVLVIGIGADSVFIFSKVWTLQNGDPDRSTTKILKGVFHHAYMSMFITSLTTAVALLASILSSITTVRCFSIFAATTVIANCAILMIWLPATVVISEIWFSKFFFQRFYSFFMPYKKILQRCMVYKRFLENFWNVKEQLLIQSILNLRYVWIALLSTMTMGSAVIVLYYPKLQLPNSFEFQLLDSSHPFEKYDMEYKNMFWFKRTDKVGGMNALNYKMPLRFVWGVLPVDNGNYLEPQSIGKLELDPGFDMSRPDSQEWLLQFCRKLRKQPFYQSTLGTLLPNCFVESFMGWMERRCVDPISKMDRSPCCESETFPYNSTVFDICLVEAMADLFETPSEYYLPGIVGPKFSKDDFPTIKAVVIEYDSIYSFTMSYDEMYHFFETVESWMQEQLKTAPASMKNGWFISDFEFYDLQHVLSKSTLIAIGVSMSLSLVVLLIATLNVLTSVFAILTITSSILNTVAVLVLLGWKQLNVLESITISTAIGLAVDFSLHYAVHYRLCPTNDSRLISTKYALTHMAGPSFMAAITTGAAGAFMTPSLAIPYVQIGVFLITVMSTSWCFATFFLCSLLAIAGPQRQFGQFKYSNLLILLRCRENQTTGQMSTDTSSLEEKQRFQPSSSSVSDNHELDSLNYKSGLMKPYNRALQRSFSVGAKVNSSRQYADQEQSSSATSAITIIMIEDN